MDYAAMGKYLKQYEKTRYSARDLGIGQTIIVPPGAEDFADVSFYQLKIDFDIYATKAKAITLRIGQGSWQDKEFERNYTEARRVGLLVGGYMFWDDRFSPQEHMAVISAACNGKFFDMEIWVDFEHSYGGQHAGLKNAVALMELIEASGIKCHAVGMYTGYYYFIDHTDPVANASQYSYLSSRPLWLAWYASPQYVKVPPPWVTWTIWQWGTPVVSWGQQSEELDMNKPNGKIEEMYGGVTPPPGGSIVNAIINLPAGVEWSNMRAGPGTSYADLGNFYHGTEITYNLTSNNYVRVLSAKLNGVDVLTDAGKRMDEVEVWTYKKNVLDVATPPPPSENNVTITLTWDDADILTTITVDGVPWQKT